MGRSGDRDRSQTGPDHAQSAEHAERAAVRVLAEGVGGRVLEPIAAIEAGLGTRRFYRVRFARDMPASAVARVERPEDAALRPAGVLPEPPLEPIRALMAAAGLPVPRRLGSDAAHGIELLEDVGSTSLQQHVAGCDAAERFGLYEAACDLVPRIQALEAPADRVAAFDRRLDATLFRYKAEQLVRWGLPWMRGRPVEDAEARLVHRAFDEIAAEAANAPQRLAHRDLKAANLHVRPAAGAVARLTMIDLQGAFLAPPEYDLVCLLRDFQSPLPEDEVRRHLERTRPHLPDAPKPDVFFRRFDLLTLSRVGKDLSRFVYAMQQRGDARSAHLLPNAVTSLRRAASRLAGEPDAIGALAQLLVRAAEDGAA